MGNLTLYLVALVMGTSFSASTNSDTLASLDSMRITVVEQRFANLANSERWNDNIQPLAMNPLLVQVARQHSREMADRNYFDHVSPVLDLKTPMTRYLHNLGRIPTTATVGENLFYCSIVDADLGHKCLMDSPRHRDNILNPIFDQVGVGAYISPDGKLWVTEMFLTQVD